MAATNGGTIAVTATSLATADTVFSSNLNGGSGADGCKGISFINDGTAVANVFCDGVHEPGEDTEGFPLGTGESVTFESNHIRSVTAWVASGSASLRFTVTKIG